MANDDMEVNQNLSNEFNKAASFITSSSFDVSVDDRLYLYSRYKQATEGECNTSKPGIFDLQGKKKWEAWKSLKQLSREESMKQYISKVSELEPTWKLAVPEKTGWVSVSTMMKEPTLNDSEKNIFDFVQENNLEKLKSYSQSDLNERDSNDMTLLHWASDRGYLDMVIYLCNKIPQLINSQDNEGQTPLHYAVSCSHEYVVQFLLENKVDPKIKDNEGMLPIDLTENDAIIRMLKNYL